MPVIWLTIVFCSGVFSAALFNWGVWQWVWIGTISCILLGSLLHVYNKKTTHQAGKFHWSIICLVGVYFLGGLRYQLSLPDFSDPEFLLNFVDQGMKVEVIGIVEEYPQSKDQVTNLIIETKHLENLADGSKQLVGFGFRNACRRERLCVHYATNQFASTWNRPCQARRSPPGIVTCKPSL